VLLLSTLAIGGGGAMLKRPSGYVKSVNLTSTGTTWIGYLSGGSAYEIDIYVYIPEGTSLPSSTTAELLLIASPSSESPP